MRWQDWVKGPAAYAALGLGGARRWDISPRVSRVFVVLMVFLAMLLLLQWQLIEKNNQYLNYQKIIHDDKVSKVSIIGAGMVSNPGVVYKMFSALGCEQINILAISTSEIKISVLVQEDMIQKAVKILHKKFDLD